MEKIIFLLQKESDLTKFHEEFKKFPSSKIFTLDYESHFYLETNKIDHEIAENLLSKNDLEKIDKLSINFIKNWIPKNMKENFMLNDIFLPNLIEHELFFYLIPIFLINLLIIKIIKKENPSMIFDLTSSGDLTQKLIRNNDSSIIKINPIKSIGLYHDDIQLHFSFVKIPLDLKISRNTFQTIKQTTSRLTKVLLNSNLKTQSKNNILLVNFDPLQYDILLEELKNFNINIILYNPRKPAITNLKSFNIVKNSNSKIFDIYEIEKLLDPKISSKQKDIENSMNLLFFNDIHFENLFMIDDVSFWSSIKNSFKKICVDRFNESIKRILVLSKFFSNNSISLVLQWAEVGQEEKECMNVANNFGIPSLMLQHGRFLTAQKWLTFSDFTGHFPKSSLSQKQFVWGNLTKKFALSREYQDKNILLSGSPRHDRFFNSTKNYSTNNILLATTGAMNISADTCTTNSQLKYDAFIKKIYDIIKQLPDKKLIIRPHPSPVLTSNVSNLIKNIDDKLPVMKNENLFDLIQKSELVITFNNSTICLDALSMKKPVISLQTDNWALDEEIVKMNGILSIDNLNDCEMYVKKILYDLDYKNDILQKSKQFLDQYLINQGNASKSMALDLFRMIQT